ncbi:MAG: hypothetical protein V3U60_13170, partial [Gammaproteobacteria bacterium]
LCSNEPTQEHRRLYSNAYEQVHYNIDLLKPGMILCVESYIGSDGGEEGVKLEQMVLITDGGNRVLSTYEFEDNLLSAK